MAVIQGKSSDPGATQRDWKVYSERESERGRIDNKKICRILELRGYMLCRSKESWVMFDWHKRGTYYETKINILIEQAQVVSCLALNTTLPLWIK